ncbi:MAG: murein L,D-transpeptidase catalytic domain family protein [Flavobacteriales bacterium]|nr:murein L,D-transpeptidase catalytic domain family protein [Flavobacteriales bacterium]
MKSLTYIALVLIFTSFTFDRSIVTSVVNPPVEEEILLDLGSFAEESYNRLGTKDLFFKPYNLALKGYYQLLSKNKLRNTDYLTIVDFTKSSSEERMFIIDTKTWQVVHTSLVAHGMKTGDEFAETFSNTESSHQSSLGFYVTGEVYDGKHNMSLKLDGQEYSNSNARDRGVVVHAADYVSEDYIKENGRLGRSFGCPALPHEGYNSVIEKIKDGSCFFIYYPEKEYMKKSKFLNTEIDVQLTCDGELG